MNKPEPRTKKQHDNLCSALALMLRVKKEEEKLYKKNGRRIFNIRSWQGHPFGETHKHPKARTERELVKHCGTTACFGGWLPLINGFKRQGLKSDCEGSPNLPKLGLFYYRHAFEHLFGIPYIELGSLCGITGEIYPATKDINDVIERLRDHIENTELVKEYTPSNELATRYKEVKLFGINQR